RHVEVKVIGVSSMARSERHPENFLLYGAFGQQPEKSSMGTPRLTTRCVPVLTNTRRKPPTQVRGQLGALFFARRSKLDRVDIYGISEGVLTNAGGTVARLATREGAHMVQLRRLTTVYLYRHLIDQLLKALQSSDKCRVHLYGSRKNQPRPTIEHELIASAL